MKFPRFRFSLLLLLLLSGATSAEDPAAVIERVKDDAKTTRVKADCLSISSALRMYKINAGRFPTEKQGLRALVEKPADEPRPVDWVRSMSQVPKDPWGREYSIRYREKEKQKMLFVVSKGPDPEVAEDDIEHPVDPPKAKE
jgi:general secretion pathway protein G